MYGNRLKSLRKHLDKTQEEVAAELGVTRGAYSHFENDRNEPDSETLRKLADYFQVSTDYLLGRTDETFSFQTLIKKFNAPRKGQLNIGGLFNKNDDWPEFLAQLPEDQAMHYENTDYPDEEKIAIMELAAETKQKKLKKIEKFMQYPVEVIDDALIYAAFDAEQRKKMNDEN